MEKLLQALDLQLFASGDGIDISDEEIEKIVKGEKNIEDDLEDTEDEVIEEDEEEVGTEEETEDEEESVEEEEETEDGTADQEEETEPETPKKQSRKENSAYARARRESEQKAREEEIFRKAYEEGRKKGRLENSKVNEFTGTEIVDESDLEIYEMQKAIKDKGGDPIKDLAQAMAEKTRQAKAMEKKRTEEQNEKTQKAKEDIADFKKKYPNVSDKELNMLIQKFTQEETLGTAPLRYLYADYLLENGNQKAKVKSPQTSSQSKKEPTLSDDDLLNPDRLSQKDIEAFLRKYKL